jgi:hypothetical protein
MPLLSIAHDSICRLTSTSSLHYSSAVVMPCRYLFDFIISNKVVFNISLSLLKKTEMDLLL